MRTPRYLLWLYKKSFQDKVALFEGALITVALFFTVIFFYILLQNKKSNPTTLQTILV